MGDSRLSVTILLDVEAPHKIILSLPADSPLSELVAHVKDRLDSLLGGGMGAAGAQTSSSDARFSFGLGIGQEEQKGNKCSGTPSTSSLTYLAMYDCTLHPPKDVTAEVIKYNQPTGPNSITLQSMNWFPSAKLAVFQWGDEAALKSLESDVHAHEDFQYNLPSSSMNESCNDDDDAAAPKLQILGEESKPARSLMPSEIFKTVEKRFDHVHEDKNMSASQSGDENVMMKPRKVQKRRTEKERWALLDDRLKKLDETSGSGRKKSDKVSSQVKKMLIKSRAEGDKKIRQEDRFYLETVVMQAQTSASDKEGVQDSDGDENLDEPLASSYRFFSRSSNVGKIVSSATKGLSLGSNQMVEVIVKTSATTGAYRRLPNTMMIYDAEAKSHLSNFDRVIVRIFRRDNEGAGGSTPLIGSSEIEDEKDENICDQEDCQISCGDEIMTDGSDLKSSGNIACEENQKNYQKIQRVIEEMDSNDKTRKKKKTASTEKVRQILMKGKAKGDKKIPEKDRFYLEVIAVNLSLEVNLTKVFVSKYDHVKTIAKFDAFEVLKNKDDIKYFERIQDDLRFKDAEEKGIIKSFDRIIMRQIQKDK